VPTLCPELQWPSVYPNPTCPTAETLPLPVGGGQIPVGKQHQFVLPTNIHNYTRNPTDHGNRRRERDSIDECHSSHEFQLQRGPGQHPLTGTVQFHSFLKNKL